MVVSLNGIPVKIWKCLGEVGFVGLTYLFNVIFKTIKIPYKWRFSNVIQLYKNKGDIQNCNKYRSIKWLRYIMKLCEKVIEGRLREDIRIAKNQFDFMPGKSTMETIHLILRLLEFYGDKKKDHHMVFINLEKAYDM